VPSSRRADTARRNAARWQPSPAGRKENWTICVRPSTIRSRGRNGGSVGGASVLASQW
jgi:hypothetical protein